MWPLIESMFQINLENDELVLLLLHLLIHEIHTIGSTSGSTTWIINSMYLRQVLASDLQKETATSQDGYTFK